MTDRTIYCDDRGRLWWQDWCRGDDDLARLWVQDQAAVFEFSEYHNAVLAAECLEALEAYDRFHSRGKHAS